MRYGPGTGGFLLFEVMISVVILTTALLFITRSLIMPERALARSKEIFDASLAAEKAMLPVEMSAALQPSERAGSAGSLYAYRCDISSGPVKDVDLVKCEVTMKSAPSSPVLTVATYNKKKKE
jgi:Tfp pilus assembly protein PilV